MCPLIICNTELAEMLCNIFVPTKQNKKNLNQMRPTEIQSLKGQVKQHIKEKNQPNTEWGLFPRHLMRLLKEEYCI